MKTTQQRINFVCSYMLAGRQTTRSFDSCLENADNHQVAAGIWARGLKNPKIMQAMPRYFAVELMQEDYNKQTQKPLCDEAEIWLASNPIGGNYE